jgi:CRISPR system Cascade subunit CasB
VNGSHPLIDYLTRHIEDRGMLAALRRGLGRPPGGAPEMFPYVIPFVRPKAHHWEEANLYLIASLFAMHPSVTSGGNMGAHLRAYAKAVGDDQATTRRFVQLMRMRREMLDVPLRQHISLLKSRDIAVDWNRLLRDLSYWSHEDGFVQYEWAKAYWENAKPASQTDTQE